jgi:CHAT domain-containing protein/tetratricopeptide (TPR) repeat protein
VPPGEDAVPPRPLRDGEIHSYKFKLEAHSYVRVQGYFDGVDAAMALYGGDGSKLEEVLFPTSVSTQKSLMWTTDAAGIYRFEVRARNTRESQGHYRLRVERLVQANNENDNLIIADRASYEAYRLKDIGTEDALRRAIPRLEEAITRWHVLGELYNEYETLMLLGEAYFNLSEYEKSLVPYQQALAMRQIPGWRWHEVWAYNNIGRSYEMLGEADQALKYFQLGVEAVEAARNENPVRDFGIAYTALGAFYLKSGEKQKALEYLHKAIPYWRNPLANGLAAPDTDGEARVFLRLGELYGSLGQTDKADEYLQQAARVWRGTSDPVWLVRALNALGQSQCEASDFGGALASFSEALQVARQSGSKENEAYALANLGQVNLSLSNYESAQDHLQRSLALMIAIRNQSGQAYALTRLGLLSRLQGKPAEALDYFSRALALRETVRDREGIADALYQLACLHRDLGDLAKARDEIQRSKRALEFVRSSLASREMRASFSSTVRRYYELEVDLLMQSHQLNLSAGFDRKAFEASEQGRARALLETLIEAGVNFREGVDPALVERERSVQQRLNAKTDYQIRLLSGKHSEEEAARTIKQIDGLANEYEDVRARISAASPQYAVFTQPPSLSLADIRSRVLDDNTALLEYELGEMRSFLWLITKDDFLSFELPGRAQIESLAREFHNRLSTSPSDNKVSNSDFSRERLAETNRLDAAGSALAKMILEPALPHVGNKRLLIVPDGALHYISFAALGASRAGLGPEGSRPQTQENQVGRRNRLTYRQTASLIRNHEIITLPSASTLALLRDQTANRALAPNLAAVFADPVFSASDERVNKTLGSTGQKPARERTRTIEELAFDRSLSDLGLDTNAGIPRLFATRREADSIAASAGRNSVRLTLDFAASKNAVFNSGLDHYQIVHFATHALVNSKHPALSGILLSLVDKQGQPQNGFLQAHELYNLKLPAELVVLSACDTALGKEIKGEGLISLTRGFMYAGARRVVSSLWKVDSKATAELMTHFYRELLVNKLSPAAALRAAQVSMSHNPHWSAPYYWAGFIIQGEYR